MDGRGRVDIPGRVDRSDFEGLGPRPGTSTTKGDVHAVNAALLNEHWNVEPGRSS